MVTEAAAVATMESFGSRGRFAWNVMKEGAPKVGLPAG
jgi:hypothetical protein